MTFQDPIYELIGEAMQESPERELQFALVEFRTMKPAMQKDFLVGALDEFCGLAKEGKIDSCVAGQILFRAKLIASFVDASLDQPGKVRLVVNRA